MWTQTAVNITARPKTKTTVIFKYSGPLSIKSMKTSCGCSVAKSPDGKTVHVTYTAPEFPPYLKALSKDSTTEEKRVTVTMSDDSTKQLHIRVTLMSP